MKTKDLVAGLSCALLMTAAVPLVAAEAGGRKAAEHSSAAVPPAAQPKAADEEREVTLLRNEINKMVGNLQSEMKRVDQKWTIRSVGSASKNSSSGTWPLEQIGRTTFLAVPPPSPRIVYEAPGVHLDAVETVSRGGLVIVTPVNPVP